MRKLLKHDIKDTYLEIAVLNGMMIVFALLALSLSRVSTTMYGFAIAGWGITITASTFIVLSSIIKSFHKKLFTDHGYLTLTTPVSIDKLLLSKFIVNMLWILATCVSVMVCIFLIFSSVGVGELFLRLFEFLKRSPKTVVMIVVSVLVYALYLIAILLFVLVLVNTGRMKRHKLLKGLLIYMGISFITSMLNPFNLMNTLTSSQTITTMMGDFYISLAINFIWSVAFYFISRYLITHKLELE